MKNLVKNGMLLAGVWLVSCSTPDEEIILSVEPAPVPAAEPLVSVPESTQPDPFLRARLLADILYEAKIAFEDNRLMSPEEDNAFDRYLEVLSLDPENFVALDGIEEIVLRYIELADEAQKTGKYEYAESLLEKAASIKPGSDDVMTAFQNLDEAKKTKTDFFELDGNELQQQSTLMLVRLSEIAEHVKKSKATFLITARTDTEARWIYKVMRESVGGYRLRGNIELGLEPGIQVNVPQS